MLHNMPMTMRCLSLHTARCPAPVCHQWSRLRTSNQPAEDGDDELGKRVPCIPAWGITKHLSAPGPAARPCGFIVSHAWMPKTLVQCTLLLKQGTAPGVHDALQHRWPNHQANSAKHTRRDASSPWPPSCACRKSCSEPMHEVLIWYSNACLSFGACMQRLPH